MTRNHYHDGNLSFRRLRFESLENREMLSACPVDTSSLDASETVSACVELEYPTIDLSKIVEDVRESSDDELDLLVAAWNIKYGEESQSLWDDSTQNDDRTESEHTAPEIQPLEVCDGAVVCDCLSDSEESMSSGGSGGSGGSGDVCVYLSGGQGSYYEGQTIGLFYSGLPSGYTIYATVVSDNLSLDTENSVLQGTSSCGGLSVRTLDDYAMGGDKTVTIQLSLSGEGQLSSSSFVVTVFERPEFISGEDSTVHVDYNDDSYRAYVHCDASEGTSIVVKDSPVLSKGGIGLRYCFTTSSTYFNIDPTTGAITLAVSASTYVEAEQNYQCNLTIRVYESRAVAGLSSGGGGECWADEANITISFSHWNVVRMSTLHTASVMPNDGCTIAMLAKQIGLTANEYRDWLTFETTSPAHLYDGLTISWEYLNADDVLASDERYILSVPNTIVMAWLGECRSVGKSWMHWDDNQNDLETLGFCVETFDNDLYDDNQSDDAKNAFLGMIRDNSSRKRLHGLYVMGHGWTTTVGSEGSHSGIGGPEWQVEYGSVGVSNQNSTTIGSCLRYKMGALVLHACYGSDGNARDLTTATSEGGIFWGWSGTYNPILDDRDPIFKNWGLVPGETVIIARDLVAYHYVFGGLQETHKINRAYSYTITNGQ